MSEKELLYVEDAISHIKQFKTKCENYESLIQNEDLKNLVCTLKTKHIELFNDFYGLL